MKLTGLSRRAAPAPWSEGDNSPRQPEYGSGYDPVRLLYGEFDGFRPGHARAILEMAASAQRPGGRLALEPAPESPIRATTSRWYVIDAATAEVARYASSYQACSEPEQTGLIESCGFGGTRFFPNLTGSGDPSPEFIFSAPQKRPGLLQRPDGEGRDLWMQKSQHIIANPG